MRPSIYQPPRNLPPGLRDAAKDSLQILPACGSSKLATVDVCFIYRSANEKLSLRFEGCRNLQTFIDFDIQQAEEPWNIYGIYEINDELAKKRFLGEQIGNCTICYSDIQPSDRKRSMSHSSDPYPNPTKLHAPDNLRLFEI